MSTPYPQSPINQYEIMIDRCETYMQNNGSKTWENTRLSFLKIPKTLKYSFIRRTSKQLRESENACVGARERVEDQFLWCFEAKERESTPLRSKIRNFNIYFILFEFTFVDMFFSMLDVD